MVGGKKKASRPVENNEEEEEAQQLDTAQPSSSSSSQLLSVWNTLEGTNDAAVSGGEMSWMTDALLLLFFPLRSAG